MPARIIKPTACHSPTLAVLSHGAERLWWRLLTQSDDYGLFQADERVAKGQCMPTVNCSTDDVGRWMRELEAAGLVVTLHTHDRLWGMIIHADRYFHVRTKHRNPEVYSAICKHLQTSADKCLQMQTDCKHLQTEVALTETLKGRKEPAPLSTPKGPDLGLLGSVQPPEIPTNSETKDSHKHPLVSQDESPNPRIIKESPTPHVDSKGGNPNIIKESGDTTGAKPRIIGESATSIIETGMIRAVFATYREHHPRAHPKPRSTGKEWRAIKARLAEGYSVADLRKAIDGCHASPFHMGENERGRRYDSLELIARDSSKVAQFMELLEQRDQPVLSTKIKTGIRATENWLESKRKELSRERT